MWFRIHYARLRVILPLGLSGMLLAAVSSCEGTLTPSSVDPALLLREYGWPGTGSDRDLYLALNFDTVGTTLTGQWLLAFQALRATDEGRFTGRLVGDSLTLELNPGAGCTAGYRLEAIVRVDASRIHGRITPQAGTIPVGQPDTVTLIPSEVVAFPAPLQPCP